MKKWFSNNILYLIGAKGTITGYVYWQKVGCTSGTCLITSNPLNSSIYSAVMGVFLLGMFKNRNNQKTNNKSNDI